MSNLIIRRLLILLLIFSFLFSTSAQDDPYPTLTALQEAQVPFADPVELAERFLDVTIGPSLTVPHEYALGDHDVFNISSLIEDRTFAVEATLRGIGEYVYVWVHDGSGVPDAEVEAVVRNFDNRVYGPVRELWGEADLTGIDGDPRIHILFSYGPGIGAAAYFGRLHTYPTEVFPTSAERELIVVNLEAFGLQISSLAVESTLAHEFQHMLRNVLDPNESSWLDEGFSTFTQRYVSGDPVTVQNRFMELPFTQVNVSGIGGGDIAALYGARYLFVAYFYERFGLEKLHELSIDRRHSLEGIDHVLADEGGVDLFFADWVLANLIRDTSFGDGIYGYTGIAELRSPTFRAMVSDYPARYDNIVLNQYAADYYNLNNLDGAQSLQVTLKMPQVAPVISTDAFSGDFMAYSNSGDVSNARLTREFDLSGLDSATLTYRLWYAIEADWDYGYLTVSTDGGEKWATIATEHTTTFDPQGYNYGNAYTGVSREWLSESVSLDAYVGQTILLRFETITDDATLWDGLAVDDISVPELDYFTDFETDLGGWQAEGWVRMDNRLPQQAWVQVVQFTQDDVVIERQLFNDTGRWTVALETDTERVVVAVSPIARSTTVPMEYTLELGIE